MPAQLLVLLSCFGFDFSQRFTAGCLLAAAVGVGPCCLLHKKKALQKNQLERGGAAALAVCAPRDHSFTATTLTHHTTRHRAQVDHDH